MRLYVFLAKILLVCTPFLYFMRAVFSLNLLNNIKDVLIISLGVASFFLALKNKLITGTISNLFFMYALMLITTLMQLEDTFFYLVGIRELLVYPIFYILISIVLNKHIDLNKYICIGVISCLFLMCLFLLLYPAQSYGLTHRFKAFFDREHLPAIFSALAFIYSLYYIENRLVLVLISSASLFLIAITGTRSVFLLLIFVFCIYYFKISLKSIVILLVFSLATLFIVYKFFTREVFYNLEARTHQYELARLSIEENFIFGIGVDKYGVLGDKKKYYNYKGYSTVTMDSSFIKYVVNIGVPLSMFYLIYIFFLIFRKRFDKKEKDILVKRVLLLAFFMGTVTGKFGAYPLNLIFFMNLMIVHNNKKSNDLILKA